MVRVHDAIYRHDYCIMLRVQCYTTTYTRVSYCTRLVDVILGTTGPRSRSPDPPKSSTTHPPILPTRATTCVEAAPINARRVIFSRGSRCNIRKPHVVSPRASTARMIIVDRIDRSDDDPSLASVRPQHPGSTQRLRKKSSPFCDRR